jgi:hypothetical protein
LSLATDSPNQQYDTTDEELPFETVTTRRCQEDRFGLHPDEVTAISYSCEECS